MRRSVVIVAVVIAVLSALFVLRSRNDPGPQPPVLGTSTRDTSGFYEEIGVFENDTSGDVVTIIDDSAAAPPPPAQPSREESFQRRQRAITDIPRYQTEMTKQPRNALAINNYAWSLHLAGKYADAEGYLREAISIAPDREIAYANLGETLWKLGRRDEAAAMYRKFLELNTNPRREKIAEGKVAQITGNAR